MLKVDANGSQIVYSEKLEYELTVQNFGENSSVYYVELDQLEQGQVAVSGQCAVYDLAANSYAYRTHIVPTDSSVGALFGAACALSDTAGVLIVGAPGDDAAGADAGRIYIYDLISNAYTLRATLAAHDAAPQAVFGSALALSGDATVLAVAAAGFQRVYLYRNIAGTYTLIHTLETAAPGYGMALALSGDGNTLFIGADNGCFIYKISTAPILSGYIEGQGAALAVSNALRSIVIGDPQNNRAYYDNSTLANLLATSSGTLAPAMESLPSLIAVGDILATPVATGAELHSHHGFSASNYIAHHHHTGLDLPDADWRISVTFNATGPGTLLSVANYQGGYQGAGYTLSVTPAGTVHAALSNNGFANADSLTTMSSVTDGARHTATLYRSGDQLHITIDGQLAASVNIAHITQLQNEAAWLQLGVDHLGANALLGSIDIVVIDPSPTDSSQLQNNLRSQSQLFTQYAAITLNGQQYTLEQSLSEMRDDRTVIGQQNTAIGGGQAETIIDRKETKWDITTTAIKAHKQGPFNELLYAAEEGNLIEFTPGSESPRTVQLRGSAKKQRHRTYHRYTLKLIETN